MSWDGMRAAVWVQARMESKRDELNVRVVAGNITADEARTAFDAACAPWFRLVDLVSGKVKA